MSGPEYRDVLIALWPIGGKISIYQHAADCSWETAMECQPLALKRVRIQVGEFSQSPADDQNCIAAYTDPPALIPMPFPLCRAMAAKMPEPEKRREVFWINLYPDGGFSTHFEERRAVRASIDARHQAIGRARVVVTEGQFDEPLPGDPV